VPISTPCCPRPQITYFGPSFEGRSPYYGSSRFVYDAKQDLYRFPEGKSLRLYTHSYTERLREGIGRIRGVATPVP
jgi:hypothetical protein